MRGSHVVNADKVLRPREFLGIVGVLDLGVVFICFHGGCIVRDSTTNPRVGLCSIFEYVGVSFHSAIAQFLCSVDQINVLISAWLDIVFLIVAIEMLKIVHADGDATSCCLLPALSVVRLDVVVAECV